MFKWKPKPPRYAINPVAFVVAFVLSPVLVTLLSFWMVIPVAALFIGCPAYVVVGLPVLLLDMLYNKPNTNRIAFLAFISVLVLGGLWWVYLRLIQDDEAGIWMLFYTFALIFAPLWTLPFTLIYNARVFWPGRAVLH